MSHVPRRWWHCVFNNKKTYTKNKNKKGRGADVRAAWVVALCLKPFVNLFLNLFFVGRGADVRAARVVALCLKPGALDCADAQRRHGTQPPRRHGLPR